MDIVQKNQLIFLYPKKMIHRISETIGLLSCSLKTLFSIVLSIQLGGIFREVTIDPREYDNKWLGGLTRSISWISSVAICFCISLPESRKPSATLDISAPDLSLINSIFDPPLPITQPFRCSGTDSILSVLGSLPLENIVFYLANVALQ